MPTSSPGAGMTLGECLRGLRISDPYLHLREAASAASVTPVRLSHFEANRERPTAAELSELASAYNVDGDQRMMVDLWEMWDRWEEAPPPDLNAPGVIVCRRGGVDA